MLKKILLAAAMVLSFGTTACAEEVQCPTVTGSELSRHGNYNWMLNTYDYKNQRLIVVHTTMPWRLFQSDMFLSSFLGAARMQVEANTGDTIVTSSIEGEPIVAIWQPDITGFSKGYIGSYETVQDVTNSNELQGCFKKFINLQQEGK